MPRHRHRLTGQPVVLVDPFPPCGILRRVIFAHLSGERIKRPFQPEQLLLATVDVQADRDVLRSSRPNSFRRKLTGSSFMGGALRPCCFTGLSRADLDPLHLMYLMVVVVAAVDAVDDVSLTQSETIWRCAYRCEEQEITRGGSWDGLPDDPTLPLDHPQAAKPKINVFLLPQCFPHLCGKHILCCGSLHCPVEDRLEACDQRRTLSAVDGTTTLVITNDPKWCQRPDACLIRFVSSVTWLNTLRVALAIRVRIFRSACITVVMVSATELLSDLGQRQVGEPRGTDTSRSDVQSPEHGSDSARRDHQW